MGFVVTASLTISNRDIHLKNIDERCSFLEKLAPPYIWGGFWGLLGGDCSGQTYYVFNPDFPGKRTTAYRMWLGYGNWGTDNVKGSMNSFKVAQFPNQIYFNYGGKTASHVGTVRKPTDKEIEEAKKRGKKFIVFAEASSSSRYFKRTIIYEGDARYKAILGIKILDIKGK